jgi:hypothetical protein
VSADEEEEIGTFGPDVTAEAGLERVDPEEVAASMRSAVARLRAQLDDVYNVVAADHPVRPDLHELD